MLILSSFGFSYTKNRLKIGESIPDKSGMMLIIPLACMFEQETGEKEKTALYSQALKKKILSYSTETPPTL